ncbi:MAG: UDP-N-acetylmuramoyl-tripeptide--D-alanyl-D-alanine ligase [Endomicrobiales bacterium]
MENFYLHELINAAKGEFLLGDPHSPVRTLSIDTRTIRSGDFFVALTGKNFDGHDFLRQAVEKRIAGVIVSRKDIDLGNPFPAFPAIVQVPDTTRALGDIAAYYRRKWQVPLAAVTGSNGKTTTKEMLASILSESGPTLCTHGNFNNQIGLPLTLLNLMPEHRYAVVEMGTSFPGEIRRLAEIALPTLGIVTNIGAAHLERLKDKEGVLREKSSLFDGLAYGGCAVLNADDPYLQGIVGSLKRECVTFGITGDAQVRARDIRLWPDKPSFELRINDRSVKVRLSVHGKFNVYNALAAAAAAWHLGIGIETIKEGLEKFLPVLMRMETRELRSGITVINDAYNANPSSMREAIEGLVQSFPDREKIVVLGDMLELGNGAEEEHRLLGEFIASRPLSRICLFGPLMEKALEPLKGQRVRHYLRKEELEVDLKDALTPGTVVFFKASRGMRLEDAVEKLVAGEEINLP